MDLGNDFVVSVTYKDGMKCEWKKKDKQYEAYVYDGHDHVLATLERLIALPLDRYSPKDGTFYKGNSDSTSWKSRYFYLRGGLLTYFKDKNSVEPKGTIPLRDCVVEYPNDKRKSFVRLGRSGVDGFELKISHVTRRPFIVAFPTSKERDDWQIYLTRYIAQTFASAEYHLAEVICSVSNGLATTRKIGTIGINGEPDQYPEEEGEPIVQYIYIDWYAPDPGDWCIRYAPCRLHLQYSSSGRPNEFEFDSAEVSRTLPLQRISKVIQTDSPTKCIRFLIYNGSSCHPGGIGEVWTLFPPKDLVSLWTHAFQSILALHDTNIPTQPHRRSSFCLTSLKAQLSAPMEPVKYTWMAYVKEKYSIQNGNEFDLLGVGVQELAKSLLMQDIGGHRNEEDIIREDTKMSAAATVRDEAAETDTEAKAAKEPSAESAAVADTVFQFPEVAPPGGAEG
jgi:hypothetical protein